MNIFIIVYNKIFYIINMNRRSKNKSKKKNVITRTLSYKNKKREVIASKKSRKRNLNSNNKKSKKKSKKYNIIRRKIKKKLVGGGIFGGKKAALEKAIDNVQYTETQLIKKYKSHARASKKFYDVYNDHILNLQKIDAFIPKLESFQELFTDVVMPNDIKPYLNVNMTNPLLINQYNINSQSTPRDIAVEHVKQQVKYCMFKYFHFQDTKMITDISVEFDETQITITFVINNFKKIARVIHHIGYKLDMNELKASLQTIIEEVKENVEYDYKPKEFDKSSILRIAPRHKSAKQQGEREVQILGNGNESANMDKMIRKSEKEDIVGTKNDDDLAKMLGLQTGQKFNNNEN